MSKVLKAGCILLDIKRKKIALVYRKDLNDYSFPKGHLESNETLSECAIRETAEETKRNSILLDQNPVYMVSYVTQNEGVVEVYYYLSRDIGKSDNDSEDTHPTIWVDYDNVYDKLSYDNLKELWLAIKDRVYDYFK